MVRESHRGTVRLIGGQAQRESIMAGIIILLTPAPIIDSFIHSERQEMPPVGGFGCLELCLYDIRIDGFHAWKGSIIGAAL